MRDLVSPVVESLQHVALLVEGRMTEGAGGEVVGVVSKVLFERELAPIPAAWSSHGLTPGHILQSLKMLLQNYLSVKGTFL